MPSWCCVMTIFESKLLLAALPVRIRIKPQSVSLTGNQFQLPQFLRHFVAVLFPELPSAQI